MSPGQSVQRCSDVPGMLRQRGPEFGGVLAGKVESHPLSASRGEPHTYKTRVRSAGEVNSAEVKGHRSLPSSRSSRYLSGCRVGNCWLVVKILVFCVCGLAGFVRITRSSHQSGFASFL